MCWRSYTSEGSMLYAAQRVLTLACGVCSQACSILDMLCKLRLIPVRNGEHSRFHTGQGSNPVRRAKGDLHKTLVVPKKPAMRFAASTSFAPSTGRPVPAPIGARFWGLCLSAVSLLGCEQHFGPCYKQSIWKTRSRNRDRRLVEHG